MRETSHARAPHFEERAELERWALSSDEDSVRRARIILLSSERRSVREIADAVGSHAVNVKKWIRRFNESGLSGLTELKRGPKKGTRSRFSKDEEEGILAMAAEGPRALGFDFDRWSPQKLADAAVERGIVDKISHVTVRAMLREAGLEGNGAGPGEALAPVRTVEEWSAAEPRSVVDLMEAGEVAFDRSDNAEAASRFREVLAVPNLLPATEAAARCRLAQALEGLAQYDEALDVMRKYEEPSALSTLPVDVRGRVNVRLGWIHSWLRNYPRAIARLNEAIKFCREIEARESLADAHSALGRTYMQINESGMARDHLQRAIELQSHAPNRHFLAQVYLRLGNVEFNEGDADKALSFYERARESAEGTTDDNLQGAILLNLAVACVHSGRVDRSRVIGDLERAIDFFKQGGHRAYLAQAYQNLGDNLRFAGDWPRALENIEHALDLGREAGDVRAMADPLVTKGEIAFHQGRYDVAQQCLGEALDLLRRIEDRWGEAYTLRVLGNVYHRIQQPIQALRTLRDALHLATVIKDLGGVTASHLALADLHIAEEKYEQAEEYLELASGALKAFPSSQLRSSGLARRLGGRLEMTRGRYPEAQQLIAQSVSIFTAVGDIYEVGISHLEMGDLLGRVSDIPQAQHHLDQAIEIFSRLGAAPDLARAEDLRRGPGKTRPLPPILPGVAPAAPDHKASDVLLMFRLIEASASRNLLLQELLSIVVENFSPGRVLLVEISESDDMQFGPFHGYSADEARVAANEIQWALASSGQVSTGTIYTLDDRTGTRVILSVERVPPIDRLRPLLRQTELGLENCALRDLSRRAAEPVASSARVETVIPGFIFAGNAMREVIERIHKIRTSDVTVLITGESGTGKELVARAIHAESERRSSVFLPFNCTATPKEIIDSQLFGHRRGAFTGATSNYSGIIRAAEGGTLFLDEVGDLAFEVQPKLLRFLESGEIQPIGEAKPSKVDVRVVAATNMDLERAVEEGRFREDLYHRLNIIRIHVPPLRDRREEIPILAEHFLRHFADREGKGALTLTPDAMAGLTAYGWPGNVRNLRNEMERVVAYSSAGAKVTAGDLSPELAARTGSLAVERSATTTSATRPQPLPRPEGMGSLKEATAQLERKMIEEALERSGYDLGRAARELGLPVRGLHMKMSQLRISRGLVESQYL